MTINQAIGPLSPNRNEERSQVGQGVQEAGSRTESHTVKSLVS